MKYKIRAKGITAEPSSLQAGWYIVFVNEFGHAITAPITQSEARNCILSIGDRP